MSVHHENVEVLRGWLAQDSPVRSASSSADALMERLAGLGLGQGWPEYPDRVDDYAQSLSGWFAGDTASESTFNSLTQPSADADALINWLLEWVNAWESGAAGGQAASATDDQALKGFPNPNTGGPAGTEYYRTDESGAYLYAATEDSTEWLPYAEREKAAEGGLEAQFKADLPDPEKLADQIVTDIGSVVGAMIAEYPELAKVDADTLAAWIAEDVESTLKELGESGWEVE
jgi:hypothetical protein